ncbi:MAG: leucine-rich repeat protein [Clostridia bacterium]|nr:leucine-rich repeat protein [Clostridia bacterium]
MTKNKHRFISLLLAAAMILCLLPAGTFAADVADSGECGENVTWTLDSNGLLTISGTGNMKDYSYKYDIPCDSPFWGNNDIREAIIEAGVTKIGSAAFYECENLTRVTIPEGVTSIGEGAFSFCSALESVTVPDGVTSIDEDAFHGCGSLTEIILPDSLTSIGTNAFLYCSALTSIEIPNGVTSIGGGAFGGCGAIASVTIPEGVTAVEGNTFSGCTSLTSVTVPDSVTYIGFEAFSRCTGLTSFVVPADTALITGFAFSGCEALESITFPEGLKTIERNAFQRCESLSDVYFKGTEEQWKAVTIEDNNDPLIAAAMHFAEQPAEPPAGDNMFSFGGEGVTFRETEKSLIYASEAALTKSQLVAAMTVHFEHAVITVEKDGFPITDDAPLGTGALFYVYLSDEDMIAASKTVIFMGDTDGDGTVNATDARLALRAAAKLDALEGAFGSAADTDGDGNINATDARGILRAAAKLDALEVA